MPRGRRRLTLALSAMAAVALLAMMAHTVLSTTLRTVADDPVYGTYEIVESWYLPIIGLVGLLAAHLQGEHIRVTALVDRFPQLDQRVISIARAATAALFCFFVAVFSFRQGLEDTAVGMTAGVTTIPIWPVLLMVPVAFFVLGCFYVADVVGRIRQERDPAEEPLGQQGEGAAELR